MILGIGDLMVGRLLAYDALSGTFREFKLRRNPACAVCGDGARAELIDIDYEAFCGVCAVG